ncbi:MAG: TldD/PmbA family protein [Desulfurococcaceae archaeon]
MSESEDLQLEVDTMIDFDLLIRKAASMGLSEVEVYLVDSLTTEFKVANDRIIESTRRKELDIGIRGAIGKKVGGIRVNTLSESSIELALDRLVSMIKASPEDPYWSGFPPLMKPFAKQVTPDEKTISMSEEEYVDLLKYTMDRFKEPAVLKGAKKAVVVEGSFDVHRQDIVIMNSNGVYSQEAYSGVLLWLTLSVEKNGSLSDKSLAYYRSRISLEEIERKAVEEGERSLLFFDSRPVESGTYEIVLYPSIAGAILSISLAPAFSALNILENRSPIKDKYGMTIVSEKVTMIDDPFLETATGTRSFDDEGVPTRVKRVVDRGVFKTILQSYYTSRRMNIDPTGNGVRQSPSTQPIPGFNNLVLEGRSGSIEEFTRQVDRGIIVFEVIGYWMSDPVTGSVKATVTHGLLVERGEAQRPVKGVVIGGNIYDWLSKDLVEIGKDNEIFGNTALPSIWIRDVKVAGK